MKRTLRCAALLAWLSILNFPLSTVFAQGTLTPPGAPAPTMKTLAQIEPRTPISSAPFTITNPGAYYLTASLTVSSGNAIVIATNGVSVDLNGFTLKSTEASPTGYAILINSGLHNLTIVNGYIEGGVTNSGSGVYSGPGFSAGISVGSATFPLNTRISGVSVTGCLNSGINVDQGDSTIVELCTVRTVGGSGIVASTVRGCVAKDCGLSAIYGYEVADSRGESGGSGYGVYAITANNCYGYSPLGTGLNAGTATGCYGYSSGNGSGLIAYTATSCYGASSGNGYGVSADMAENCEGTSGSGAGLNAQVATGCRGYSNSGRGVAAFIATGCYGTSSGSGSGLVADYSANNCYGTSSGNGSGVSADMAENCEGNSIGSGTGLSAVVATGCRGYSNSGTGVGAFIATGCSASSFSGTPFSVTHPINCF